MSKACALTAKPMTIAAKANVAFPKGDRLVEFFKSRVVIFFVFIFLLRLDC